MYIIIIDIKECFFSVRWIYKICISVNIVVAIDHTSTCPCGVVLKDFIAISPLIKQ